MKGLVLLTGCLLSVGVLVGGGAETNELSSSAVQEDGFVLNGTASRGRPVFEKNCVACHGPLGDGQGPLAQAFDPRPGDLASLELQDEVADKYLYTIVGAGGPAVGKCMEMGAWKNSLTDQQIRDVVAYIKTLSSARRPRSENRMVPVDS